MRIHDTQKKVETEEEHTKLLGSLQVVVFSERDSNTHKRVTMKTSHQRHPETSLAVNWIAALLHGKRLPDLSKPAKTSPTKEVAHV